MCDANRIESNHALMRRQRRVDGVSRDDASTTMRPRARDVDDGNDGDDDAPEVSQRRESIV